MDKFLDTYSSFFISASYSDASYSSDEEDGGLNPRETQQVMWPNLFFLTDSLLFVT